MDGDLPHRHVPTNIYKKEAEQTPTRFEPSIAINIDGIRAIRTVDYHI
jgi:hypothetical protein